jgi:hypothetical protein
MEKFHVEAGKAKPTRNPDAVYERFKTVSRIVSKFVAITKTHFRRDSGQNGMDHYNYCAQALEHQQKGLKINDYYLSYIYLKDCPKWIDYDELDKADQEGRVARPIGKKAAIKKRKQEELVVSTVEEVLEKIKKEESPHTPMANVSYPTYSSEDNYNNNMEALLKQANEQHQASMAENHQHNNNMATIAYINLLEGDERKNALKEFREKFEKSKNENIANHSV